MSKDNAEENPEEDNVKVHEIKFDEYGIMDDGLDASTNEQLNALGGNYYIDFHETVSCFLAQLYPAKVDPTVLYAYQLFDARFSIFYIFSIQGKCKQ